MMEIIRCEDLRQTYGSGTNAVLPEVSIYEASGSLAGIDGRKVTMRGEYFQFIGSVKRPSSQSASSSSRTTEPSPTQRILPLESSVA